MKFFILILAIGLSVASCKVVQNIECLSKKTVPVTFIGQNGIPYTVDVPYCDTILIKSTTKKLSFK